MSNLMINVLAGFGVVLSVSFILAMLKAVFKVDMHDLAINSAIVSYIIMGVAIGIMLLALIGRVATIAWEALV